jgi:hypothetical protein
LSESRVVCALLRNTIINDPPVEESPLFFIGIATFFVLADDVDSAWYLTLEEKRFLHARRLTQQGEGLDAQKFHWKDVRACFLDWKCYGFAFAQFGVDTMVCRLTMWCLTDIRETGLTFGA